MVGFITLNLQKKCILVAKKGCNLQWQISYALLFFEKNFLFLDQFFLFFNLDCHSVLTTIQISKKKELIAEKKMFLSEKKLCIRAFPFQYNAFPTTIKEDLFLISVITHCLRPLVMYGNELTCAEKKSIPRIASSGKDTLFILRKQVFKNHLYQNCFLE